MAQLGEDFQKHNPELILSSLPKNQEVMSMLKNALLRLWIGFSPELEQTMTSCQANQPL